jgi:hypothetical protein
MLLVDVNISVAEHFSSNTNTAPLIGLQIAAKTAISEMCIKKEATHSANYGYKVRTWAKSPSAGTD